MNIEYAKRLQSVGYPPLQGVTEPNLLDHVTLEGLIMECGNGFMGLTKYDIRYVDKKELWGAVANRSGEFGSYRFLAEEPQMAVAMLYVSLKENSPHLI